MAMPVSAMPREEAALAGQEVEVAGGHESPLAGKQQATAA